MKTEMDGREILIEELQGDCLTPVSIFQRLKGRKKFLLESSLKHEKSGRFSFIGTNPSYELKGFPYGTLLISKNGVKSFSEKPLELLKTILPEKFQNLNEEIPFIGGAVGFVTYDVVRHYEQIPKAQKDELGVPDVHLMMFEEVVVFDHLKEKVFLIGIPLAKETTLARLQFRLNRTKQLIQNGKEAEQRPFRVYSYEESMKREEFIEKVNTAKRFIENGDVLQVVLSRRMTADFKGDAFSFYRRLRIENPSPYMYYFDFGDYSVAGASPESLIKVTGKRVMTKPIAGTRPRGNTPSEDAALEKELLQDEKELAEHRMLVDLGRNDLGRICRFGTVKVDKYMAVEKYKHVMHIVSEVSGELSEEHTPVDALISCLPAGTVSGAPKLRAMEIINELEQLQRGFYSGAVGYLSANGNMDFAIAIRTMLIKNNRAYIQAGAGIVQDSVPEKEYDETFYKMKAFLEDER